MGKRPAASKATRGVYKAKNKIQSSSSNPKTKKYRSQSNSLALIAKKRPERVQFNEQSKKLAKEAIERKKLLNDLKSIDLIEYDDVNGTTRTEINKSNKRKANHCDDQSDISRGTQKTAASFASVWSQCTNSSMNEFFQVWDPKLETHKDALAVVAGLSQSLSEAGTEQTDLEFTKKLFKILSAEETPINVVTGSLLALTFVIRKLPADILVENFDQFYASLKDLLVKYHSCKKKTLIKCLLRCFSCLSKAHPMGKDAIEANIRKKINIAIRQYKVQSKIQL